MPGPSQKYKMLWGNLVGIFLLAGHILEQTHPTFFHWIIVKSAKNYLLAIMQTPIDFMYSIRSGPKLEFI